MFQNSEDIFSVEPLAPNVESAFQNVVEPEAANNFGSVLNYGLITVDENNALESNTENSQEIMGGAPESTSRMQTEDDSDNLRNSELIQDEESDTEYNFNEAETDSDSDDNQSNQEGQRSEQTGATAGSDTGKLVELLFYFFKY